MLAEPRFDRESFFEIAERSRELIRGLYPEWTNDNAADPGITLLELFAYLKEIQNFHMEQTGPAYLKKYLKLLGITPLDRRPGRAFVTVNAQHQTRLPGGSKMYAGTVCFETTESQTVAGPVFKGFETEEKSGVFSFTGEWLKWGRDLAIHPFGSVPEKGKRFVIRLLEALSPGESYGLYMGLDKEAACPVADEELEAYDGYGFLPPAALELYVMTVEGWERAGMQDETLGLGRSGLLRFRFEKPMTEEAVLFILLRSCDYQLSPVIVRLSLAMAPVRQQETRQELPEYEGTGFPDQRIDLEEKGLCGECFSIEAEEPGQPGLFLKWQYQRDLDSSGPEDRHFTLDGCFLVFGNGHRGMIPEGKIRVTKWIRTLGKAGNIKSGTISTLELQGKSRLTVTNEEGVVGGRDEETLEEAFKRYKNEDFSKKRAVTLKNYEDLVMQAPGIRIDDCRAYITEHEPGKITIAVKPKSADGMGMLTETVKRNLYCLLEEKRLIGVRITLLSPEYVYLNITCEVVGRVKYRDADRLVEEALKKWMQGMRFGEGVSFGRLFGYLDSQTCVLEVKVLRLETKGRAYRTEDGDVVIPPNGFFVLQSVRCRLYAYQ